MRLTRMSMVAPLLIAAVTLLAPPAVADGPEDLGPPFLLADGDLACNAAGGFYGSPSLMAAPRPAAVPTSRSDVRCTASHRAEKGGALSATLTAHGRGNATEGTYSSFMSYGFSRHRMKRVGATIRYAVTVAVDEATADVAVQYRPTTFSAVLLVVHASHHSCKGCEGNTSLILADSDPRTDTPERVQRGTRTIEVDITEPNGKKVPYGTVGIVAAVFPMVFTGTYASPAEALGSASVRARITRITAATA